MTLISFLLMAKRKLWEEKHLRTYVSFFQLFNLQETATTPDFLSTRPPAPGWLYEANAARRNSRNH